MCSPKSRLWSPGEDCVESKTNQLSVASVRIIGKKLGGLDKFRPKAEKKFSLRPKLFQFQYNGAIQWENLPPHPMWGGLCIHCNSV